MKIVLMFFKWLWRKPDDRTVEGVNESPRTVKIGSIIMIAVLITMLAKCDWKEMNKPNPGYTLRCIDGIEYVRFQNGGASVAYTAEGMVKGCK